MYVNQNSKSKQLARDKVLARLNNYENPTVISLPADNFIFEQSVRQTYPKSKIVTLEQNKLVFNSGKQLAKNLNINHLNGEIFDYLKNNNKYDVIWLDLCGYLSGNMINNLIPIVQGRNTKKETILALTVMATREKLAKHSSIYGFSNLKQFRKKGLTSLLQSFASMNDCTIEQLDFFSYKGDKKHAAKMNLYIYKLTKN